MEDKKTDANGLPHKYQKSAKVVEIDINGTGLKKCVDELELSVRSMNCLKNDNIIYVEELVQKTESELLRTPNFGRKSLNELREALKMLGLRFGSPIKNYLVINTYNTFDLTPGKVYSRIQLVDHVRKL